MNTQSNTHEAKDGLRQEVLAGLKQTSPEQRSAWSSAIVQWLTASDAWIGHGGTVALFGGLKWEADILSLIPWLRARGLRAALLAIEPDRSLTPYVVHREEDIISGVLGALEPRRDPELRLGIGEIGTVLVPGRAFSLANGTRLGLGKGHYDRFLAASEMRGRKIGVGFALQMTPTVPAEAHDVKMDALLSESGWTGLANPDYTPPAPLSASSPEDVPAEQLSAYLLKLFT